MFNRSVTIRRSLLYSIDMLIQYLRFQPIISAWTLDVQQLRYLLQHFCNEYFVMGAVLVVFPKKFLSESNFPGNSQRLSQSIATCLSRFHNLASYQYNNVLGLNINNLIITFSMCPIIHCINYISWTKTILIYILCML